MRILIIEDEASAVNRLRKMLAELAPGSEVVADVPSIAAAVEWIKTNEAPDLALVDVQLADGESFAIFERVQVDFPVVFTTAYDEHALRAFRVNALDYLLKPIRREELQQALERAGRTRVVRDHASLARPMADERPAVPVRRFLIRYGEHFKVIEPDQIAYIHSLMKNTFLRTLEGRDLPLEESMDKL